MTTQIAFCPHCGNRAPQKLIHTQSCPGRWYSVEDGEISKDGRDPESNYYIAVCMTCEGILLYHDPIEKASVETFTSAGLIWPKIGLHGSVPKAVVDCYVEAERIKYLAPNAFAVQVRRALEALCDDRGATKGSLQNRLKELIARSEIPPVLGEMTEILRLVGNMGAHVTEQTVKPIHVLAIDDFFRVIVEYVYVGPSKLKEFRERLSKVSNSGSE